jgi:hypothetical protein
MRRFSAAALAALVLVAVTASAGAVIVPNRSIAGVGLGMTPAQVQAKLGRPVGKAPGRWFYPQVWVVFQNRRVVELTTTRYQRFSNGIGIDSTEPQIRAAFPRAVCGPAPPFRRCRLGTGEPGSRVTDLNLVGGRVVQITISQL